MTATRLPDFEVNVTLVAYTRDELEDLASLADELEGVPLQLHLRGATLDFPQGLDERQIQRLVDYASVLDWQGQRSN